MSMTSNLGTTTQDVDLLGAQQRLHTCRPEI